MSRIKYAITRSWKAIAGLLAGLTAVNVDWITNEIFSFDLPAGQDAAIATLVAGIIVFLFPANADKATVEGNVGSV